MALFTYFARDRERNAVSGEMEGRGAGEVADVLLERGLTPISIVERRAIGRQWLSLPRMESRPELVDLIFFCRQMYSITKAGLPLHRGLRSLIEAIRHPTLRRVLVDVRRRVEEGRTMSETMATHRGVFPPLMINMVRVGEQTGRLDTVFGELQRNLEFEEATRRQVKAALRYPTMVIIAIAIALVVLNLFVIPAFAKVFANFNAELPLITRALIASSDWMRAWWPLLAGGLLALTVAIRVFLKTARGAELWGRWSLRIPLVGEILLKAALSRFTRTLGMSLRAGIPLDQALQTVASVSDNRYFALQIAAMHERIAPRPVADPGRARHVPVHAVGDADDHDGRGDRPARRDAGGGGRVLRTRGGLRREDPGRLRRAAAAGVRERPGAHAGARHLPADVGHGRRRITAVTAPRIAGICELVQ